MKTESFTIEEIEIAKAIRDSIIKGNVSELKSVYMAGEIVMWDEMQKEIVLLKNEVENWRKKFFNALPNEEL